jgi:hypothetical protein
MRSVALAIVFALSLMRPAEAGPAAVRGAPAVSVRVPLLPFTWVASRVRGLFGDHAPLANASALNREQGWTFLELPVNEPARALYLEVDGRVQFDSAEIVFQDGDSRPLDLRDVVRGRGLFQLHDFGGTRQVLAVRLNLRAATARAAVGLRIARFGLALGDG